MYRTHFYSNSEAKIKMYKLYSNKVNIKLKNILKINYYYTQFEKHRNSLKNTWKLIGTLIRTVNKNANITHHDYLIMVRSSLRHMI
jgi:Iap family predicted aminopeptidase